jgi:putative transposase
VEEQYYERNLPHWYPRDRPVFLTWRLYGSLPYSFVRKYRGDHPTLSQSGDHGVQFVQLDAALDAASYGPLWLSDPIVAESIVSTLKMGESRDDYSLLAYVLMANHIHLLIQPHIPVAEIMKSIKGITSRNANKILDRTGKTFWQDESFDHWTRSPAEEQRIRCYIENNPVKAHLAAKPQDWPWSSAAS